jgi:hypothetical protein
VGFWAVFAILSLAFQCGLPHPWVYTAQKCNSGGVVYAVVGLNIISDLYLSVFFIPTIWSLETEAFARITLASLFLSKLLYVIIAALNCLERLWLNIQSACIAGAVELVFLSRALPSLDQTCPWTHPPDPT